MPHQIHRLILQRFAAIGQTPVADITKIDTTMLSRFLSGERGLKIDQIGPVLSALGLHVVETNGDVISMPADEAAALRLLARKGLALCIQPWQFGHGETKATCLWLKGLPKLTPTNVVEGREARVHRMPPGPDRWKERSRTYFGVGAAMASQWGAL